VGVKPIHRPREDRALDGVVQPGGMVPVDRAVALDRMVLMVLVGACLIDCAVPIEAHGPSVRAGSDRADPLRSDFRGTRERNMQIMSATRTSYSPCIKSTALRGR
jgi:hypothetical protein